jgi:disulfide bond formation protein DsbB
MQKSVARSDPAKPRNVVALFGDPATLAVLLGTLGIGLLLGAFAFEYFGVKPCHLCLGQRLPWPIMAVVAGGALLALRPGAPASLAPMAFATAAVIALWSAYLAAFHAGVEWQWWPGPPECTGTAVGGAAFSFNPDDIVRCDTVAWSLFGLSLAGYNFIFSLIALALAAAGAVKTMRAIGG